MQLVIDAINSPLTFLIFAMIIAIAIGVSTSLAAGPAFGAAAGFGALDSTTAFVFRLRDRLGNHSCGLPSRRPSTRRHRVQRR
jgi:hypothetical protein